MGGSKTAKFVNIFSLESFPRAEAMVWSQNYKRGNKDDLAARSVNVHRTRSYAKPTSE